MTLLINHGRMVQMQVHERVAGLYFYSCTVRSALFGRCEMKIVFSRFPLFGSGGVGERALEQAMILIGKSGIR